jgi:two-component system, NtrC family, sensor histidine kinase HydH
VSVDPAWLDEAKAYVGFAAADEALLRGFHDRMASHFAAVIDHFYEAITDNPQASRVITGGPAQILRLKGTLRAWLSSGLTGPHDAAWFAARARIGRRHVEVGLPDRYMFTAMNLIRADLKALARDGTADPHELGALCDALDRWLDLELAIMVHSYQEDSERRLLDRERDALSDRLAAVQRLSAGLAHEVRNPLNAAQLQLQLLARRMRRCGAEESLLDVTTLIDAEIRRLSQLLQEFLDFARPAQIVPVPADLVAIARKVVDLTSVTAQHRGITLHLGGDASVTVACDPGKIQQVAHNLVINAIEAASSQVEVAVRATETGAELCVRDDGPGIPGRVLPRLYEPFFSTKEGGTGMGLSISYSLVALHGGAIAAHNAGGAVFTVSLPAEPPALPLLDE